MSDQVKTPIRFRFDTHGLGDCVHAAVVLRLYIERGYDVAIQVEANKRWLWEAMGIPIYDPADHDMEPLPLHPYHYPHAPAWPYDFWNLSDPDCLASKIAHFVLGVGENVLPRLGTPEEVWRMIADAQMDADISWTISPDTLTLADKFIEHLPRPIFGLHSRGTNWSAEKSIPDGVAFETIMGLLKKTNGSVIVFDFDRRAPTVAGHDRCRTLCADWTTIELEGVAALLSRLDLLIGIDSGPFHLAQLIPGLKTLGIFRKIPAPRCCIPSPNATYLVPGRDHVHWQRRLDASVNIPARDPGVTPEPHWNFMDYRGEEPTSQEIVDVAIDLLIPPSPAKNTSPTLADFLAAIPGVYLYRRTGHDERRMVLNVDGTIGLGSAGCELKWRTVPAAVDTIAIYGEGNRETCKLFRSPEDGVYRGRWNFAEKMPIELVPVVDVVPGYDLWNGRQVLWSPAAAADAFPSYPPGCGMTVGTRGNGTAWLLDTTVQRSDLDSCGVDESGAISPYVDHEDWIWKYLDMPAGSVCLDLASFIGTVAVWWAKRGCVVLACEPLPPHRDLLHKNIRLNQVADRVAVIPKAFGAAKGTARMSSDHGAGSFTGREGNYEVEVSTVDAELLPELTRLDVIKLDVEGAECEVIDGAWETIKRFKPKLVIEVHSHMDGRAENGTRIAEQLTELGYTYRRIWENIPSYFYLLAEWQGFAERPQ